jgi:hypothetical protein
MTLRRAIPKCTPEQQERQDKARACGCTSCRVEMCAQPLPTEINHIAERGRQIGQDYTEALCQWHHRGICVNGMTSRDMTREYGPSLAKNPRAFVDSYGDTNERLRFQNDLIGWKGEPQRYQKHTSLSSSKIVRRAA